MVMYYFFPNLSATTVCPSTFLVTGGMINLQKTWYFVSSTAVTLTNDAIKGSDPISDASVKCSKKVATRHYISQRKMFVCVIQYTVHYSRISFGMPYFMHSFSLGKQNETVIYIHVTTVLRNRFLFK